MPNPPRSCARDSAAEAHLVGRSREGARTERGIERWADRPTDGRPRTRRRIELSEALSHTHTHTHSSRHRDTRRHTHTLACTTSRRPACPPARRRPEPALAGKCGVTVRAFVWGAGRRRARGPSRGGLATETSSSPQGRGARARPRHAPIGLPTPPDWGEGSPSLGEGAGRWGAGRE